MNVTAKVRILVTALSAWWIVWIGWGPHTLGGMDLANVALDRAASSTSMLTITFVIAIGSTLAMFLRDERHLNALLAISLVWWVFIAVWLLLSELPTAGGLAAIGTVGGFVAYWNAIR